MGDSTCWLIGYIHTKAKSHQNQTNNIVVCLIHAIAITFVAKFEHNGTWNICWWVRIYTKLRI